MDDRPLAQRCIPEESISARQNISCLFSASPQGSPCRICPQQCCHEQIRMILMSVRGMSSLQFGYAADAFEFGFDDEGRKTRTLVLGVSNFMSKESRESQAQVPEQCRKQCL
jgi:hypothetical protein